jgi:hypothetical protein
MPAEKERLLESQSHRKHWERWGPYLAERSWANPREDYSANGDAWNYFPHDHARSRVYRWTEDGILGICDNHQRLCFAFAFWNGRDPILKERLFGLSGPQGNHGEDVKEYYYYLDSTPTHSYMKGLYKYPQREYPYEQLVEENGRRDRSMPEYELMDTGIFDEDRYFDVLVEYAKADFNDILIRVTATNRGPEAATLHLLPTVWFRNTWSWSGQGNAGFSLHSTSPNRIEITEPTLGTLKFDCEGSPDLLFTNNETNSERLFNQPNVHSHYKDAFHDCVIHGRKEAVRDDNQGTKACAWYQLALAPGENRALHFRLYEDSSTPPDFDTMFQQRIREADEFYAFAPQHLSEDASRVQRQALAGLLWSKQFYNYVVEDWLKGDPDYPPPPPRRKEGRNSGWTHIYNDDVLSMPDKWEYPWYAAWDLAFHMIPLALVDPDYAKRQLSRFLREWYMAPNGQLPAYEWEFSDVNPPVHAWACWRVFKIDWKLQGKPDYHFLEAAYHKLLMNFTWWVNRKDSEGNNIFEGGFLGLDNIGVFDRSKPLPGGGHIEQADGTAWMAAYCLTMLRIALDLSPHDSAYEDIASKFFEHFLYIATAINQVGGMGLWDDQDGFYYDCLRLEDGSQYPLRVRSVVGFMPVFAVATIDQQVVDARPGFKSRMKWFVEHRPDLCGNIASITKQGVEQRTLLSVVPKERLLRILSRVFDENEFLSPGGLRSLSRVHKDNPFVLTVDGESHTVDYEPAESRTNMFGGNSNWRGPVWFPVNFLMVEALQRFHHYFGDDLQVEFPTRSGRKMNLSDAAAELSRRLSRIFLQGPDGRRAVFGANEKFQTDPNFRDYIPFHEYFNGDTLAGLGASHQTGWTALVAKLLQQSGE